MKKIIVLFLIFYFLTLFQTSFLNFLKINLNLVSIFFLLILIFEKNDNIKLISAILGGFLLDIFSNFPLGTTVIAFLLTYFLIKIILHNIQEMNLPLFAVLVILAAVFIEIILPLDSFLLSKIFNYQNLIQFNFGYPMFFKLFFNLIFGIVGFYILKLYKRRFT